MRKLLAALMLGALLSASSAAEDQTPYNCQKWNSQERLEKIYIILGWLEGTQAADTMTREVIMNRLWPEGHRIGSVVVEVNAACRPASAAARTLREVIIDMAERLNSSRN